MPQTNQRPRLNINYDGKFESAYPLGDKPAILTMTGTIAHGNTITIADPQALLGTRANVKPLYVNLGDSKTGSSLGRITTTRFHSSAVAQTAIKAGQLAGAVKFDFLAAGVGSSASFQGLVAEDPARPMISYIERRYEFDMSDPYYRTPDKYKPIGTLTANTVYRLTIDGVIYSYTSGSTAPTSSDILTALTTAINADAACPVTANNTSDVTVVKLIRKVATTGYTISTTSNMAQVGSLCNVKRNRVWPPGGPGVGSGQNIYLGNPGFIYTEYVGGPWVAAFARGIGLNYSGGIAPLQWLNEEYVFINGSLNAKNGQYRHYQNNTLLNSRTTDNDYDAYIVPTQSSTNTNLAGTSSAGLLGYHVLDQASNYNGEGVPATTAPCYYGYQCWDDEHNAVYAGNAQTLAACTKLVRMPQTAWSETEAQFQFVESLIPSAETYFYIQTGLQAWRQTEGIR